MNYIHDVYLNFDKYYFDFYEWKKSDDILHIKKIPIIRTNSNLFKQIISNKIKINSELYNQIKNKTETVNQNIELTCLIITDNKNIYAIKFDENGISEKYSSFTLDDEYNVLYYSKKIKENNINFDIIKKNKIILETREEIIQKSFLLNKVNNLPIDTLKYIYYECFNKEETDYRLMKKCIITEIVNNNYILNNKIYNILKPISTN